MFVLTRKHITSMSRNRYKKPFLVDLVVCNVRSFYSQMRNGKLHRTSGTEWPAQVCKIPILVAQATVQSYPSGTDLPMASMPKVASQRAGWAGGNAAGDCGVWTSLSFIWNLHLALLFWASHISHISNIVHLCSFHIVVSLGEKQIPTGIFKTFQALRYCRVLGSCLVNIFGTLPWNLTDKLWDVKFVELFLICAVTGSRPSDSEPICQDTLAVLRWSWQLLG